LARPPPANIPCWSRDRERGGGADSRPGPELGCKRLYSGPHRKEKFQKNAKPSSFIFWSHQAASRSKENNCLLQSRKSSRTKGHPPAGSTDEVTRLWRRPWDGVFCFWSRNLDGKGIFFPIQVGWPLGKRAVAPKEVFCFMFFPCCICSFCVAPNKCLPLGPTDDPPHRPLRGAPEFPLAQARAQCG